MSTATLCYWQPAASAGAANAAATSSTSAAVADSTTSPTTTMTVTPTGNSKNSITSIINRINSNSNNNNNICQQPKYSQQPYYHATPTTSQNIHGDDSQHQDDWEMHGYHQQHHFNNIINTTEDEVGSAGEGRDDHVPKLYYYHPENSLEFVDSYNNDYQNNDQDHHYNAEVLVNNYNPTAENDAVNDYDDQTKNIDEMLVVDHEIARSHQLLRNCRWFRYKTQIDIFRYIDHVKVMPTILMAFVNRFLCHH